MGQCHRFLPPPSRGATLPRSRPAMNHRPTRRTFLGGAAAALAASALPAARPRPFAGRPPSQRGAMKILVLGGTSFPGPGFGEAAWAEGHTADVVHRGKA